jgi:hypothetical protein
MLDASDGLTTSERGLMIHQAMIAFRPYHTVWQILGLPFVQMNFVTLI